MKYKDVIELLKDEIVSTTGILPDSYELHLADEEHVDAHTLDWSQNDGELSVTCENGEGVCIKVRDAKRAIALLGNRFFLPQRRMGIHPTAVVEAGACVGERCSIGPHVVIRSCVVLGNDVRVESGSVIGNEGFGFVRDANGDWLRFPQLGRVLIGDSVEIGANTTIDRGALSDTVIARDVKINSNVHIAHNVTIGEHAVITANVNISGSSRIGANVWVGPGVTIRDHIVIGNGAYIGIGSNVVKPVPGGEVWCGNPARKMVK